jgi:hypothetical protein
MTRERRGAGGRERESPMTPIVLDRRGVLAGVAAAAAWGSAVGTGRAGSRALQARLGKALADTETRGLLVWDPRNHGYVAEEFFLAGEADVFESVCMADSFDANTRDYAKDLRRQASYIPKLVKAAQPYVTRLVVYRPVDPARFSGNLIVEPCHPSGGGTQQIWRSINNVLMADGDAYMSVQHPLTLQGLASADPQRYGALSFVHPSQLWTMLAHAGTLARSPGIGPLGGVKVSRAYMTGYSYTGVACAAFANYHHDQARLADGGHVFDGYAPLASAMYIQPLDVPVIRLNTQSDFNAFDGVRNRNSDSDEPGRQMRHYELAGAAHVTTGPPTMGMAEPPSLSKSIPPPPGQPRFNSVNCAATFPPGSHPNDYPTHLVAAGLMKNLYAWVDHGLSPPRAPKIEVDEKGDAKLGPDGNCLGGLRLPQVTVPIASYGVGKGHDCFLQGYTLPWSLEKRRALYGHRAAYVAKVEAASRELVLSRWLSPDSASQLIEGARASEDF